jgi:hypothetical protein
MIGLLRSTINCIAGMTPPFLTNKYDCVPSQRTSIILVKLKKDPSSKHITYKFTLNVYPDKKSMRGLEFSSAVENGNDSGGRRSAAACDAERGGSVSILLKYNKVNYLYSLKLLV